MAKGMKRSVFASLGWIWSSMISDGARLKGHGCGIVNLFVIVAVEWGGVGSGVADGFDCGVIGAIDSGVTGGIDCGV